MAILIRLLSGPAEFIKNRKKTATLLILAVGAISFWTFRNKDIDLAETAKVELGSVIQEVSVTGRVKASQAVDLAFDRSGRVIYVGVKSGDRVSAGKGLIKINDSELIAQESREKANVISAELRLSQIKAALNNSDGDVSITADALVKSLKLAVDAMVDFTEVQYKYFNVNTGSAGEVARQKEDVLNLIYGQSNLGRTEAWYFMGLTGGLKSQIDEVQKNPNNVDIDLLASKVKGTLLKSKEALEVMQFELTNEPVVTPGDIDKINSNIDLILGQISEISTRKKAIVGDGYEAEIAKSQLEQARSSLALVQAQIAKYSLVASFSGMVANIDVKTGQIISSNETLVSLMGNARFQIEANVSEADIAKISVGDFSRVTLDAYGRDKVFTAKVVHIDPAGRIVDNIATYKITLEFDSTDEGILSGLTADADILTDQKNDVLHIPSRNVISRNGKKYALVVVDKKSIETRFADLTAILEKDGQSTFEVEIKTGLKGSDGRIEVISGLNEGDTIIRE